MRNVMKGMIVFFSVVMTALIAILVFALVRSDEAFEFLGNAENQITGKELVNTENISMNGMKEINIDANSCDVIFIQSDSDEMVIKEYVSNGNKKEPFLTTTVNDDTVVKLKAAKNRRSFFIFGSNRRFIEVYLPESYQGAVVLETSSGDISSEIDLSLSEFRVNTSSGYLSLEKVAAAGISINTSSGDLYAEGLYGKVKFETQSGYVKVEEVEGNAQYSSSSGDLAIDRHIGDLTFNTSSGYSYMKEIEGDAEFSSSSGDISVDTLTGDLKIDTSSGYVKVETLRGAADVNTSSGDIKLKFAVVTGDIMFTTTSGYISCILPSDASFDFEADTNSGEIYTNFDNELNFNRKGSEANGTIGSSPQFSVRVQTSSGDIKFGN